MLPTPYYQDEWVTLYHADCREILPHLESVDLVLTDPPYGLGIAKKPIRAKQNEYELLAWDNFPCDMELLQFILSKGIHSIIWGGNYFDLPPSQCFLVWDKKQPETLSLSMAEMAWTNLPSVAKLFSYSVVSYTKQHPTQKPIALMSWCISQADTKLKTRVNSILDPFAGSGTTLRAAKDMARKSIGIEQEETYCKIIVDRLKQETLGL
jgi:DNA modification methylase